MTVCEMCGPLHFNLNINHMSARCAKTGVPHCQDQRWARCGASCAAPGCANSISRATHTPHTEHNPKPPPHAYM